MGGCIVFRCMAEK